MEELVEETKKVDVYLRTDKMGGWQHISPCFRSQPLSEAVSYCQRQSCFRYFRRANTDLGDSRAGMM